MPHEIRIIRERKKDFLELLLLADEQENMIDLYLDRGELFALRRRSQKRLRGSAEGHPIPAN